MNTSDFAAKTVTMSRSRSKLAYMGSLVLVIAAVGMLQSCGGGGGGGSSSTATALSVTSGYAPVTASAGLTYGDGAGDGSGGAAGGDGGGAGAGGDGGVFVNAIVTVARADGTVVGSAATDAYGMVSVKNNGDSQPLLFTLQGAANATYWDEAKQAQLPFPGTQIMHAMVASTNGGQTLSRNVGITPLTEAAYQYAMVNLGGVNAWKTPANIATANQAVAAEFNRFLPSTEAISDITRLAAPSRDATTQVFAAASPNNTYGLVMAALVRQSVVHNPNSPSPGLDLAQQIALDLSDGHLDGVGPGNVAVAPSLTQQAYVIPTLTADVLAAQQQVAASNGASIPVTTYALSGSVSGLNASGLVIVNGGTAVSIPANATSFTFGAVLVSDSNYSITVQAQPAGEVCTVTNGSGTAGAGNVTTAILNCVPPSFTLGGSVSGLTAGGLVLANGAATTVVAANATSFTFGAVLISGSTYNITVQTQPAGEVCSVTNGSGTAGAGNVTTPVVNCGLPPFTLSGSIFGLAASGLVLADGAATTAVAANATSFTFGAVLVSGSTYNISVQTQPADEVCSVTNGSGTTGAGNVTTPVVSCVPASFTLGGSISGLTASGLVLADGAATTAVAINATSFTFGAVLVSGSTYNVTVQHQPGGLSCAVSNGSGTALAGDVTTPTVICVPLANAWEWSGGSNLGGALPTYGLEGTPSPSNIPGARGDSVTWKDPSGNFWLMGGYAVDANGDYTYLNDVFKYDPSNGTWTWVGGSGTGSQAGNYGSRGITASSNWPGARGLSITWTDSVGNVYMFGGYGYDSAGNVGYLNDVWHFDVLSGLWTWLGGSTLISAAGTYNNQGIPSSTAMPGSRQTASAWVDSTGKFWLFGGYGTDAFGSFGLLDDLWMFNPATNQWTWVSGPNVVGGTGVFGTKGMGSSSNSPPALASAATWADSAGSLWLFGGEGFSGVYDTLWKYAPSSHTWTWVGGANTAGAASSYGMIGVPQASNNPGARWGSAFWQDAAGRMWLQGGSFFSGANTEKFGDLWKYDETTGLWVWINGTNILNAPGAYGALGIAAPGNYPGGRDSPAFWIDSQGALWLFGGAGYDRTGTLENLLNDVWKYQP